MIKDIWNFICNIIFPPRCIFCGRYLEPNYKIYTCGDCGNEIEFCLKESSCQQCGKPIVGFANKKLCYFCMHEKPKYFDRIISVFVYEDKVRRAVIKFKATGLYGHTKIFSDCITTRIFEEYEGIKFDFLCGVPPHKKGSEFDQIRLLCKPIAKNLGIPYIKNVFIFVKKVKKQSELGYKERKDNVRNSLKVKEGIDLTGKTILLIDDICTTRQTLIECSRALKVAGAKRVYCATIATVKNPN
ncbi:MAG: ComF family protein [Clostridia bacterium]|nr:ComF family protein [Clostridia bacterium]